MRPKAFGFPIAVACARVGQRVDKVQIQASAWKNHRIEVSGPLTRKGVAGCALIDLHAFVCYSDMQQPELSLGACRGFESQHEMAKPWDRLDSRY